MMAKSRYSRAAQKAIGREMHSLKAKRSMPRAQKIAIALSTARATGLKVPRRRSK